MSKLYQHSTLAALMSGRFEGTASIKDILAYGDFGIGTLEGLDGEVIIIDGVPYQVTYNGEVREIEPSEQTPFLMVTEFQTDEEAIINTDDFKSAILTELPSENTFYAIKAAGQFKRVKTRSVEKQAPPYRNLVEVASDQREFEQTDVEGTIVGFYTPTLFSGIGSDGLHLHFLSDNLDFGGHLLEVEGSSIQLSWQMKDSVEVVFPAQSQDFLNNEINLDDLEADIEQAEN